MPFPPSQLLPDDAIAAIIKQVEKDGRFHEWQPESVVRHFAFLVPFSSWFTEAHIDLLIKQAGLDRQSIKDAFYNLRITQTLASLWCSCRQMTRAFPPHRRRIRLGQGRDRTSFWNWASSWRSWGERMWRPFTGMPITSRCPQIFRGFSTLPTIMLT